MRLFDETRPATLDGVSWLRRAVRRRLAALHITDELVNDIQLVIAELATNAVKHATQPPRELALVVDLAGATLRIEIIDDGSPFAGFAEAWSAAANMDLAATESGMGLALARTLLHSVTYEPGPPNRLVGFRPLAYRRPAVLLVEDSDTLRDMYAMVLRDSYRVYKASSIDAALAIAASRKIDLILTDFHIGTDPATALLAEIERDAHRLPVPVIVLSGDPADATRARAEGYGIEQFLLKPISVVTLRHATERAMVASRRRLTGLLRHFGADIDRLLGAPDAAALARLGIGCSGAAAAIGSGDFVLHFPGRGRDRIVVADVMGHGLQAATGALAFAAMLRTVQAMQADPEVIAPGDFLAGVSRAMHADEALACVFITVLVIDRLADGSVQVASAGHPLPVRVTLDRAERSGVSGPLLGLVASAVYPTLTIRPERGERVVVVTDGVDPVTSAAGGDLPASLLATVRASLPLPIDEAVGRVSSWAADHLGPSPRDDWTIMLLEAVTGRT